MKKLIFGAACAAIATAGLAGDIGVSINIGQPGFFGQINIGDVPQPPPVIYARPVLIAPAPEYVEAPPPPLYLHVPPGHERHWASHCREYNACGRPVYFVRDEWYQREYVPHYQRGEWGHHEEMREERRHDRDWNHEREEHEHGHGHGHGDHGDHGDHDH